MKTLAGHMSYRHRRVLFHQPRKKFLPVNKKQLTCTDWLSCWGSVTATALKFNQPHELVVVHICVESSVIKELVDTEIGIVDGTATTIEKGYTYYDTYNGIKLRDSFISISVDADGITGIVDSWKERTISAIPASMVTRENMISASAASEVALQHAESFNYADIEPEVNGDLSYVPVGDNVYQLCYELTTTDGIVFISVLDGAIIEPAI